jgi:hypothetical protein
MLKQKQKQDRLRETIHKKENKITTFENGSRMNKIKKVILRSYKNLEILFKETYEYLKIFNKLCQSMCCKRKKSNSYSNLIR